MQIRTKQQDYREMFQKSDQIQYFKKVLIRSSWSHAVNNDGILHHRQTSRLSMSYSGLCSFLKLKERFSTPSGSMTDFILAPKATHRAKDTDMEEKETKTGWFGCTLGFARRWEVGISNLNDYNIHLCGLKLPESSLRLSPTWPGTSHSELGGGHLKINIFSVTKPQ